MALIPILSLPAIIIAADTNDNVLDIKAPIAGDAFYGGLVFGLKVITGSFQFASGKVISAENPSYAAGEKEFLTLSENSPLHFVAGSASDVFQITT